MTLNRIAISIGCALVASSPFVHAATDETKPQSDFLHQLDAAFTGVFEKVSPAVVIVEASKKPGADNGEDAFDFFFRDPDNDQNNQNKNIPRRLFKMPQPMSRSEGSGFIVRPDGYIYTNGHVIEDADKIEVRLKDGRRFTAKVIGTDDKTDIAVLKIDAKDLPVLPLADSDAVRVGQLCFAIGIPYNLDYSFSGGYVSAKGRSNLTSSLSKPMYEDYIQTDAAINPGNSGGPLFDVDGRVIGMNTLINGINRGLGFAVPSNMLKDVGEQLIAGGKIVRPWLGIRMETLGENPSISEHIRGVEHGVVVDTILPDAPAYKSDLRPADVITQVDGVTISNARDLQKEVLKKKVGQSVELAVWRNGKTLKVPVTAGELPSDFTKVASTSMSRKPLEKKADADLFGMQFQDANAANPAKDAAAEKFAKPKQSAGAVIAQVTSGSPADEAGIQTGDIVTEVDQKPVASAAECRSLLQSHDPDQKGVLLFLDRKGQKTYAVIKLDK